MGNDFIESGGHSYVRVGYVLSLLSEAWGDEGDAMKEEEETFRNETDGLDNIPKAMEYANIEKLKRMRARIDMINQIYGKLYARWKHKWQG